MEKLGKLLKSARERRGYRSQMAVADALGWTQTKYGRIERGAAKELPPPEDLRQIGDVLDLTMDDMLAAAGYITEDPAPDVLTVPVTDPRADLLRVLDGETDAGVETVTRIVQDMISLSRPTMNVIESSSTPSSKNEAKRTRSA